MCVTEQNPEMVLSFFFAVALMVIVWTISCLQREREIVKVLEIKRNKERRVDIAAALLQSIWH